MRRLLPIAVVLLVGACATFDKPIAVVKETVAPASADQTLFDAKIKPGPYVASPLAQGEERDLAQRRSVGSGFVHAEALERYLQGIRARLLTASGVTGVPGRTRILADGSFSAFSTADGNVFIAMGWFENFGNEDEIAALMAHELAHVLLKHHSVDQISKMQKKAQSYLTYGIEFQKQFNTLSSALAQQNGKQTTTTKPAAGKTTNQSTLSKLFESASNALPSSDAKAGTTTNNARSSSGTTTSKSEQDEKRLLRRIQWSINATDLVLLPTWSRDQERDADLLGIDLLVKANYNRTAMVSMLSKLKEGEEQRAADDKFRESQFSAALSEASAGNLQGAFQIATDEIKKTLTVDSHPPTGERIDKADAYLIKFYATGDLKPLNVESWRRAKNEPTTTTFLANYGKSFSAEQMIRKADVKVALKLARQGASGATARESYTNWVAALTSEANGANGEARQYFQNAITAREPINAAYEAYVSSLERAGNYGSALVEAEKAQKMFGDVPTWSVTRIRLLRKMGNATAAKKLELECGTSTPEYRRECGDAGNTPLGGKGTTSSASTSTSKTK